MKRTRLIALLIAAFVVACSDDPQQPLQEVPGCESLVFVTTTDFQTGAASTVCLDDWAVNRNTVALHSDAVARFVDGLVYVVNRFGGDNIQILDPANGFGTVKQFSTGNGSNPHDIAVVSPSKAYVSRYNETELWVVDPTSGAQTGSVDLSALADGDGIPEMDHLVLVGDYLYVSVQRVDRNTDWNPVGTSYVAVVDVAADTLFDTDATTPGVQPLALAASNPFSDLLVDDNTGALYAACVGHWGVQDGGVELVDPVTFEAGDVVLTGATAGGDITDVEIVSAQVGYVVVTDASSNNNVLLRFNPATGVIIDTVYAPGAFVLQDVARAPTGELLLTDRTPTKPGIRVYDADTGVEITSEPIDLGLPPFQITFGTAR